MIDPAAEIGAAGQQERRVEEAGAARIVRLGRRISLDDQQWAAAGAERDGAIGAAQLLQPNDFAVIGGEAFGIACLEADAGNAHRRGGGKWQFAHHCLRCGNV